ncbi:hypothetical protein AVEN_268522-1 [Araneus ventricosus]|uniref:Uncharacterized protein n=1 Tax=Araneus ventricosus TaxID=182803 RepID=A0A4Y2NLA5_ARAVE|nr:hypothetical protein AVEN_268522-1 [Araneus ventricosus]
MCLSVCTRSALETVVPVAEAEGDRSDAVLRLFLLAVTLQIPVLIRRCCNSGATCAVTSTHVTINHLGIVAQSLEMALWAIQVPRYFQLGASTFQSSEIHSTT